MDKYLFYKEFCIAYLNFMIKDAQSTRLTYFIDYSEEQFIQCIENYRCTIEKIEKFYGEGKKGMLSSIYRATIPEVVRFPDFLIENQQYFMDTYGVNILDLDKKKQNKIAKILERGKIKTDNEFRRILEHVDGLCQTDGNSDMIEKLNVLLRDYEELAEAKLQKRQK